MPNYITNRLIISGEESLVARIRKEIASVTSEGKSYPIDFTRICPLPKELEGTVSPMRTLSQKEYDAQEARIASGDLTEVEKNFGVSRGLTQELQDEYKKKYGACDWYGWTIANWGTKWNAMDAEDDGEVISFLTAWCTPLPIIEKLSNKYPEAEFNVRYSDEDFGQNVGEYTFRAGEIVYEDCPESGSPEAYLMASEIQDDPTYIASRIEGMEKEEIEESWAKQLIKAAYVGMIWGDYQDFVWQVLEGFAVEDENYERAQMIKMHREK